MTRIGWLAAGVFCAGAAAGLLLFGAFFTVLGGAAAPCQGSPAAPGGVALDAGRAGVVGATEYGGPGDPSSGHVGASGVDLDLAPLSFAELGGTGFTTATALGGLAFGTPLRITWGGHALVAEKQDIGLGGGPVDGRPRAIDLWWRLAAALGIPYEDGRWSGTVRISAPPLGGAGSLLGAPGVGGGAAVQPAPVCSEPVGGVSLTPGPRARLLPDGQALAPEDAPAAVRGMIAAGNAIAGRPYVYGAAHGLPLSQLAPAYDCSSSVGHLLWGGGQLPAAADPVSGALERFGAPGPGRWVTIYASAEHVYMYVAGLRWDTWDAGGPGDGPPGIGWHPLVRAGAGFMARHPVGL